MPMRILARVLVVALSLAGPILAQEVKPGGDQKEQVPTFRKTVNLVNVYFTVKDKHGALMPNLTQDQFQVLEEGQAQTIKFFNAETNLPLTLGILVDSSLSMERMLPDEKVIAADFLRTVITDKDLAFVISFDISVDLLQDLTSDMHLLRAGLEKARINVGTGGGGFPGIGQGPIPISHPKGTLLYDAVYLGANDMLSKQVGRKAIIILSDGVDQGSQSRLKDALEAAQKSDVICYVLLLFDPRYGSDLSDMSHLAEQTGGRAISVGRTDKLQKAFKEISDELRSQYALAYTPTNEKQDGSFRKIEIKSKDGYKVQARKGYYARIE